MPHLPRHDLTHLFYYLGGSGPGRHAGYEHLLVDVEDVLIGTANAIGFKDIAPTGRYHAARYGHMAAERGNAASILASIGVDTERVNRGCEQAIWQSGGIHIVVTQNPFQFGWRERRIGIPGRLAVQH